MAKLNKLKDVKNSVESYINECESGGNHPTIAGLCRRLGISTAKFKEYCAGLSPTLPPEIRDYLNDLSMWIEEFYEKTLLGVTEGNTSGAIFALKNRFSWTDKTTIELDGNINVHKQIEAEADRAVEEFSSMKDLEMRKKAKEEEEKK